MSSLLRSLRRRATLPTCVLACRFPQLKQTKAGAARLRLVTRAGRVETRPRLPDEVFSSFTPEDRKQWIALSKEGKQRILDMFKNKPVRRAHSAITASPHDEDDALSSSPPSEDDTQDSTASTIVTANQTEVAASEAPSSSADAHPGDCRRVLAQKTKPAKSSKRVARMAAVRHVGASRLQDTDSDSEFSLDLGELPDAFGHEDFDPHTRPLFEDDATGRNAWQAELYRAQEELPPAADLVSAYQTLATYQDDYEDSHDSDSSGDEDPWCDNRNAYYDSLDF